MKANEIEPITQKKKKNSCEMKLKDMIVKYKR